MTTQQLNLKNILLKKWHSNELSHFYVFEGVKNLNNDCSLVKWTEELIEEILKTTNSPQSIKNNVDIIWMAPGEDQKYSVQDERFKEILNSNDSKPHLLKKRIIVLERADLLTNIIANKLLKTLEDASEYNLFIFINSQSKSLLQTIKSRAITLRINANDHGKEYIFAGQDIEKWSKNTLQAFQNHEQKENIEKLIELLVQYLKEQISVSDFLEELKSLKCEEDLIYNLLSQYLMLKTQSFQESLHNIETLRWWEQQKTFNNSLNSRVQNLLFSIASRQ